MLKKIDVPTGLYVELKLHPTCFGGVVKRLRKVFENNKDSNVVKMVDTASLHVTGIYAPNSSVSLREQLRNSQPAILHTAQVKAVSLFGENKDTLVLELESPSLNRLHEKWKNLGAEPSFPEYKPHLTIALPPLKVFDTFKEQLLEAFDGYDIVLYREQCQPINQ